MPDAYRAGPHGYIHGWIKVGDAIAKTAHEIHTGEAAGHSERANRVAAIMQLAAKAAREGDHETALKHLKTARDTATGAFSSQRLPSVRHPSGKSAAAVIDEHVGKIDAHLGKIRAAKRKAAREAALPGGKASRSGVEVVAADHAAPDTWAAGWAGSWADASRFNTHHGAAGSATGGQFVSASGGSGSSTGTKGGAKPSAAHSTAHRPPPASAAGGARKVRQEHLRDRAKADRQKAKQLETELHALEKQHATAAKAAKIAATAAKHPHKTAAHKKAATHKAHKARKHHASVTHRISSLRTQIHTLLTQAKQLDAQAAKL